MEKLYVRKPATLSILVETQRKADFPSVLVMQVPVTSFQKTVQSLELRNIFVPSPKTN